MLCVALAILCSCFESTSILLFLNKRDLFTTKIQKVEIAAQPAFQDYDGKPNDFEDGVRYFEEKFTSQNTNGQVGYIGVFSD